MAAVAEAAMPRRPRPRRCRTSRWTLTFLWFEWPPAQALEELGKEYTKTRPNVTVKVNTVPNPQWHDAIFTQFAARKTNFDMPVLDSQNIGEAVENGSILDLTDFVKENIDTSRTTRTSSRRTASTRRTRRARPSRTPRPTACRCSATRGR